MPGLRPAARRRGRSRPRRARGRLTGPSPGISAASASAASALPAGRQGHRAHRRVGIGPRAPPPQRHPFPQRAFDTCHEPMVRCPVRSGKPYLVVPSPLDRNILWIARIGARLCAAAAAVRLSGRCGPPSEVQLPAGASPAPCPSCFASPPRCPAARSAPTASAMSISRARPSQPIYDRTAALGALSPRARTPPTVPPEWHAWLHHTSPRRCPRPNVYPWQQEHQPNLTGTAHAYRPAGHDYVGGTRRVTGGDYEAWTPGS